MSFGNLVACGLTLGRGLTQVGELDFLNVKGEKGAKISHGFTSILTNRIIVVKK